MARKSSRSPRASVRALLYSFRSVLVCSPFVRVPAEAPPHGHRRTVPPKRQNKGLWRTTTGGGGWGGSLMIPETFDSRDENSRERPENLTVSRESIQFAGQCSAVPASVFESVEGLYVHVLRWQMRLPASRVKCSGSILLSDEGTDAPGRGRMVDQSTSDGPSGAGSTPTETMTVNGEQPNYHAAPRRTECPSVYHRRETLGGSSCSE